MKIRLVCATRHSQESFFRQTALGRSYNLYKSVVPGLEIFLFPNNEQGLPIVYNEAIELSATNPAILVFVHDDVYLSDFYWANHLVGALNSFDITGVVGNKRRAPQQASWLFLNNSFVRDQAENLSGIVGHGKGFPDCTLSLYGEPGHECKLLDGLLLAVKSQTLIDHDLRFDPQFTFHFYDMDFCRQAELKGLKMGSCHMAVIHESAGAFNEAWQAGYQRYLNKYQH